ncbi:Putative TRAP-type C4-dicarboxylate transport system, DctP subunit [Desulfatibacillum aliphaticivorans]|uniref:TRAP-type C4-dicarboxylate transport system, DctP subunit n=1 Tax=Desulfatibacillum aliphaticivorans TaxID=218208 RepID=B8FGV1_DESAL|nr:TRAP transporter substrate-binding protein DctP [Desulfatibacillum aliphaticivorans]ACL05331.1 Putative TRAP-type C4-dicarboxylate transport system, DctP subunit [Desulfatibacillum aliphaticivorans]
MASQFFTRIFVFSAVAIALFVTTPCASAGKEESHIQWKLACLAPKDVGYAVRVREILIPEVEKATGGALSVKVYWGGVMGNDEETLKKMRIGQLHGSGLSGEGTFKLADDISVLGLPFLFESYDEVDYLREQMTDEFDAIVEAQGLKLLTWLDQDFDQIYTASRPIFVLEDFSKSSFITWFGPLEGKLLETMGATATPMSVMEIPSSLRSNIADGVIAPAIWVLGTQLYATMHNVNAMHIRYVPAFPVVTQKAWDMLSDEQKETIQRERGGWTNTFNALSRQDTKKCLEAMIKYGMVLTETPPGELRRIQDRARGIWEPLAGELYSREIYDQVQAHLKEYRAGN